MNVYDLKEHQFQIELSDEESATITYPYYFSTACIEFRNALEAQGYTVSKVETVHKYIEEDE